MPKAKRGRPTLFTPELAQEICHRLSNGEPLAAICRRSGMPHPTTVRDWQDRDESFSLAIARARQIGFDAIAEECYEIANTQQIGERVEMDATGKVERVIREDMLGHRKLQIETRLRLLAKWDPRRYGEKLGIGGADGLPPVQTESKVDYDGATVETVRAIAALRLKPD